MSFGDRRGKGKQSGESLEGEVRSSSIIVPRVRRGLNGTSPPLVRPNSPPTSSPALHSPGMTVSEKAEFDRLTRAAQRRREEEEAAARMKREAEERRGQEEKKALEGKKLSQEGKQKTLSEAASQEVQDIIDKRKDRLFALTLQQDQSELSGSDATSVVKLTPKPTPELVTPNKLTPQQLSRLAKLRGIFPAFKENINTVDGKPVSDDADLDGLGNDSDIVPTLAVPGTKKRTRDKKEGGPAVDEASVGADEHSDSFDLDAYLNAPDPVWSKLEGGFSSAGPELVTRRLRDRQGGPTKADVEDLDEAVAEPDEDDNFDYQGPKGGSSSAGPESATRGLQGRKGASKKAGLVDASEAVAESDEDDNFDYTGPEGGFSSVGPESATRGLQGRKGASKKAGLVDASEAVAESDEDDNFDYTGPEGGFSSVGPESATRGLQGRKGASKKAGPADASEAVAESYEDDNFDYPGPEGGFSSAGPGSTTRGSQGRKGGPHKEGPVDVDEAVAEPDEDDNFDDYQGPKAGSSSVGPISATRHLRGSKGDDLNTDSDDADEFMSAADEESSPEDSIDDLLGRKWEPKSSNFSQLFNDPLSDDNGHINVARGEHPASSASQRDVLGQKQESRSDGAEGDDPRAQAAGAVRKKVEGVVRKHLGRRIENDPNADVLRKQQAAQKAAQHEAHYLAKGIDPLFNGVEATKKDSSKARRSSSVPPNRRGKGVEDSNSKPVSAAVGRRPAESGVAAANRSGLEGGGSESDSQGSDDFRVVAQPSRTKRARSVPPQRSGEGDQVKVKKSVKNLSSKSTSPKKIRGADPEAAMAGEAELADSSSRRRGGTRVGDDPHADDIRKQQLEKEFVAALSPFSNAITQEERERAHQLGRGVFPLPLSRLASESSHRGGRVDDVANARRTTEQQPSSSSSVGPEEGPASPALQQNTTPGYARISDVPRPKSKESANGLLNMLAAGLSALPASFAGLFSRAAGSSSGNESSTKGARQQRGVSGAADAAEDDTQTPLLTLSDSLSAPGVGGGGTKKPKKPSEVNQLGDANLHLVRRDRFTDETDDTDDTDESEESYEGDGDESIGEGENTSQLPTPREYRPQLRSEAVGDDDPYDLKSFIKEKREAERNAAGSLAKAINGGSGAAAPGLASSAPTPRRTLQESLENNPYVGKPRVPKLALSQPPAVGKSKGGKAKRRTNNGKSSVAFAVSTPRTARGGGATSRGTARLNRKSAMDKIIEVLQEAAFFFNNRQAEVSSKELESYIYGENAVDEKTLQTHTASVLRQQAVLKYWESISQNPVEIDRLAQDLNVYRKGKQADLQPGEGGHYNPDEVGQAYSAWMCQPSEYGDVTREGQVLADLFNMEVKVKYTDGRPVTTIDPVSGAPSFTIELTHSGEQGAAHFDFTGVTVSSREGFIPIPPCTLKDGKCLFSAFGQACGELYARFNGSNRYAFQLDLSRELNPVEAIQFMMVNRSRHEDSKPEHQRRIAQLRRFRLGRDGVDPEQAVKEQLEKEWAQRELQPHVSVDITDNATDSVFAAILIGYIWEVRGHPSEFKHRVLQLTGDSIGAAFPFKGFANMLNQEGVVRGYTEIEEFGEQIEWSIDRLVQNFLRPQLVEQLKKALGSEDKKRILYGKRSESDEIEDQANWTQFLTNVENRRTVDLRALCRAFNLLNVEVAFPSTVPEGSVDGWGHIDNADVTLRLAGQNGRCLFPEQEPTHAVWYPSLKLPSVLNNYEAWAFRSLPRKDKSFVSAEFIEKAENIQVQDKRGAIPEDATHFSIQSMLSPDKGEPILIVRFFGSIAESGHTVEPISGENATLQYICHTQAVEGQYSPLSLFNLMVEGNLLAIPLNDELNMRAEFEGAVLDLQSLGGKLGQLVNFKKADPDNVFERPRREEDLQEDEEIIDAERSKRAKLEREIRKALLGDESENFVPPSARMDFQAGIAALKAKEGNYYQVAEEVAVFIKDTLVGIFDKKNLDQNYIKNFIEICEKEAEWFAKKWQEHCASTEVQFGAIDADYPGWVSPEDIAASFRLIRREKPKKEATEASPLILDIDENADGKDLVFWKKIDQALLLGYALTQADAKAIKKYLEDHKHHPEKQKQQGLILKFLIERLSFVSPGSQSFEIKRRVTNYLYVLSTVEYLYAHTSNHLYPKGRDEFLQALRTERNKYAEHDAPIMLGLLNMTQVKTQNPEHLKGALDRLKDLTVVPSSHRVVKSALKLPLSLIPAFNWDWTLKVILWWYAHQQPMQARDTLEAEGGGDEDGPLIEPDHKKEAEEQASKKSKETNKRLDHLASAFLVYGVYPEAHGLLRGYDFRKRAEMLSAAPKSLMLISDTDLLAAFRGAGASEEHAKELSKQYAEAKEAPFVDLDSFLGSAAKAEVATFLKYVPSEKDRLKIGKAFTSCYQHLTHLMFGLSSINERGEFVENLKWRSGETDVKTLNAFLKKLKTNLEEYATIIEKPIKSGEDQQQQVKYENKLRKMLLEFLLASPMSSWVASLTNYKELTIGRTVIQVLYGLGLLGFFAGYVWPKIYDRGGNNIVNYQQILNAQESWQANGQLNLVLSAQNGAIQSGDLIAVNNVQLANASSIPGLSPVGNDGDIWKVLETNNGQVTLPGFQWVNPDSSGSNYTGTITLTPSGSEAVVATTLSQQFQGAFAVALTNTTCIFTNPSGFPVGTILNFQGSPPVNVTALVATGDYAWVANSQGQGGKLIFKVAQGVSVEMPRDLRGLARWMSAIVAFLAEQFNVQPIQMQEFISHASRSVPEPARNLVMQGGQILQVLQTLYNVLRDPSRVGFTAVAFLLESALVNDQGHPGGKINTMQSALTTLRSIISLYLASQFLSAVLGLAVESSGIYPFALTIMLGIRLCMRLQNGSPQELDAISIEQVPEGAKSTSPFFDKAPTRAQMDLIPSGPQSR